LSLIFSIMISDLGFSLLENFDLQSSLSGPLFPKVFIKLLYALILKGFALIDGFYVVKIFFDDEPLDGNLQSFFENLNDSVF